MVEQEVNFGQSDKELEELFSSFQHPINSFVDATQTRKKKRRPKIKNHKLNIDGVSLAQSFNQHMVIGDPSNDNELIKEIGKQLGFSFPQQMDDPPGPLDFQSFKGILTIKETNVFSIENEIVDRNYVAITDSWDGM
ncbi:hypothetical protein Tco_0613003 [Tanacetum coccineum]